jgi:hypothetical protein
MTAQKKQKILSYPTGWPTDQRSHVYSLDGEVFISHPERKPHRYDEKTQRWAEIV